MNLMSIEVDQDLVNRLVIAKDLAKDVGDQELANKLDDRIKHESSKFDKMLEAFTKSLMY